MAYAKLKTGQSLKSKGYDFRKDTWVQVKQEDVGYFLTNYSNKVEFAPPGVVPKNPKQQELNGVIVLDGKGKEAVVTTKTSAEVKTELDEAEEAEVTRIREKYAHKKEQKAKEAEEAKNKKAEEEKVAEARRKDEQLKMEGLPDITNRKHAERKSKAKQEAEL